MPFLTPNPKNGTLFKGSKQRLTRPAKHKSLLNINVLAQVYVTFIEVNFEFTEGEGKRVKSLPAHSLPSKKCLQKLSTFRPLTILIHCVST